MSSMLLLMHMSQCEPALIFMQNYSVTNRIKFVFLSGNWIVICIFDEAATEECVSLSRMSKIFIAV